VILELEVNDMGRVTRATVLRSVPLLDQAAIDCVKRWEFLPALIDGRPVLTTTTAT
jgi:TonB family protein